MKSCGNFRGASLAHLAQPVKGLPVNRHARRAPSIQRKVWRMKRAQEEASLQGGALSSERVGRLGLA